MTKKKSEFDFSTGWVSTDAWRGYSQPVYAVVGASDTGNFSDSPASSSTSKSEINKFAKVLKKNKILFRFKKLPSSNVFMSKRWLIVKPKDYAKAKKISAKWLKENEDKTSLIHDADDLPKKNSKFVLTNVNYKKKMRQVS